MNPRGLQVWQNLTSDGSTRVLKYPFGRATANSLAVRMADGTWLAVSAASEAPPFVLEGLAKEAELSALPAPNGFHHRGQPQGRARFPAAASYAPGDRAAWLRSVGESVGEHLPTSALPAHGDPVVKDTAARTALLLAGSA